MKRMSDIIFSVTALTILSPMFLILMLILRLTGEGEIFFRGERIGKNKQKFKILKFATMLRDSPNIGTGTLTVGNDPRILPMGKFLRNWKINELPQLLNIFLGDMSIVGPRPQSLRNFSAFSSEVQAGISQVRPGLTGIGSLIFRNEEELLKYADNPDHFYDTKIMPYKGIVELWYVNHQSLLIYYKLIWLTFYMVVLSKDVNLFSIFSNLPRSDDQLFG